MTLIPGYATENGTARYREQFAGRLPGHFRQEQGLWLSSIGLGTYLGEADSNYDQRYLDSTIKAISSGVNVIDSAVNYRHQRSERSVGQALASLIRERTLSRDEVFVSTKGGFLALNGSPPKNIAAYFYDQVIRTGLAQEQDIAADCHVMTPKYLENQIEISRANLGIETVDLYYLHNPETQLSRRDHPDFYGLLTEAFAALEGAVSAGKIRWYGTATWNAYRVTPGSAEAVDLDQVLAAAERAGGTAHHFRAVQLPLNLAMPEALVARTQPLDGRLVPFLRKARERNLMVFASASLLQGQLTSGIPDDLAHGLPSLATDAQRALQFVRSTPGITSALVGMSSLEHLKENLATANIPPLNHDQYWSLFGAGPQNQQHPGEKS